MSDSEIVRADGGGETFELLFAFKTFTLLEGFKLPGVTKRPARKLKSSEPRF